MGEGFEDGMVMDTSPTPEVSTETIEVPEINTEPIESTDISSVDSIEPMEDVGDIEGSVDGTPSMLDQISEGGNALEEFHEADELSEVTGHTEFAQALRTPETAVPSDNNQSIDLHAPECFDRFFLVFFFFELKASCCTKICAGLVCNVKHQLHRQLLHVILQVRALAQTLWLWS